MLPVPRLSQPAPTPIQAPILSACPFPQPSCVFSDPGLQGTEIDIFSYKPTLLTSKTLEKIRPVLDYRCMVSGSEQKFLIGLGVSLQPASYPAVGGGTLPSVCRNLDSCLPHSVHVFLAPSNRGFDPPPSEGISCNITSFLPLS